MSPESELLKELEAAVASQKITSSAAENIRTWLTEPRYADYREEVVEHMRLKKWDVLDDVFWTIIPFGTGGRRGRMYPIGSNAINVRTIGESARGLAEYVSTHADDPSNLSCAIAFDTRHKSVEFSRLCAEIMVAAGFKVYYLDEHRSTPELSFLVRYKNCSCGIMVTASHNPPSDNAVKCYWSTGGQLLPPHDQGVIDCVMNVGEIAKANFDTAVAEGRIEIGLAEVDKAYLAAVADQRFAGPRDVRLIYSPLHGVGATSVVPALTADGFRDVEVFGPHETPDGDFPNVPNHVSNPENRAVFDAIIRQAQSQSADVILVTDPDCDRLGCAAPVSMDTASDWNVFNGNQIAALLSDFVLEKRKQEGSLSGDHYLVKTLVTTDMVRRIGESYGVKTHGDLLVGFKWIGGVMDEMGPDKFVFGAEESHGYLVGQYARDKDGAVAAMLFSELAAEVKAAGKSLCEKLDDLYWQHGYHAEHLVNQKMPGSEGMARMEELMKAFRQAPPQQLAGLDVKAVRDYQTNTKRLQDGSTEPLPGPTGNLVMLDLAAPGNYVAVRPSGTEPKVKYYIFTSVPAEQLANLDDAKAEMAERISAIERDFDRVCTRTEIAGTGLGTGRVQTIRMKGDLSMQIQEFVPYLSVTDAKRAAAFYSDVFETEPAFLLNMPDGRIMHCEFRFDGTRFFLSEELPEHGGTPSPASLGATTVAIHLYVEDCDAMVARMQSNGAEVLMPPADMFWGERFARVRDPFGHEWGITTRLREMTPDEIQAAAADLLESMAD